MQQFIVLPKCSLQISVLRAFSKDANEAECTDRRNVGASFLVTSHCCDVIGHWYQRYRDVTGL